MRRDMGKIVIDAERYDDRWGHVPRRELKHRKQEDDRPTKVSNSRGRFGTKQLGDNLNPLFRWLRKQVGRKWDDVYSELNTTLSGGFTNIEHIKDHVLREVELGEIRMIEGWPYSFSMYGGGWLPLRKDELFLDTNGRLKAPPKDRLHPHDKRQQERDRRPEIIMLDAMTAAAKIDGTWFKAELEYVPTREEKVTDYSRCNPHKNPDRIVKMVVRREQPFVDVLWKKLKGEGFSRNVSEWDRKQIYGDRQLYAPKIQTMSKKEIKQRIPEVFR